MSKLSGRDHLTAHLLDFIGAPSGAHDLARRLSHLCGLGAFGPESYGPWPRDEEVLGWGLGLRALQAGGTSESPPSKKRAL